MLALLSGTALGRAQPAAKHALRLEAFLDTTTHRIYGTERLTFTNHSRAALESLDWQLYLNAFQHDSHYAQAAPAKALIDALEQPGALTVLSMQTAAGTDLWPSVSYSLEEDLTLAQVSLPEPLKPGDALELEIQFIAQLPTLVQRTGFASDFYMVAQWYPKPAKLEPDGRFAGSHFHALAEFYADFADMDVVLDVPADMVVGATGSCVATTRDGGRKRVHIQATNVHDFAWTAWPSFTETNAQIGSTAVRILAPAGHGANVAATLRTVREGLTFFQTRYGAYPYPTLTVVHPPHFAQAANGMEYPSLITTGGPWTDAWLNDEIERVTTHELAHQWFYGLLASNEWRYPFLDEGLASFAESSFLTETGATADLWGITLSPLALQRRKYGSDRQLALATAASGFASTNELALFTYQRTSLLLHTLQRTYGAGALDAALAAYAEEYRFAHPQPEDLRRIICRFLPAEGCKLFEDVVFSGGSVDFAVEAIDELSRDAAGVHSRIKLRRDGTLEGAVDVEWQEASGQKHRTRWSARDGERQLEVITQTPLQSATIDPANAMLLDDNLLNNSLRVRPRPPVRSAITLGFLTSVLVELLVP